FMMPVRCTRNARNLPNRKWRWLTEGFRRVRERLRWTTARRSANRLPMPRKAIQTPVDRSAAAASALRTVRTEASGLAALAAALENGLAEPFAAAVDIVSRITGRVIVTGVGKSGHIGSKIAATLASTGTPAFFVHPAEATHGDLGM